VEADLLNLERFQPWRMPLAEPTNLIVPWCGSLPPRPDDVASAIERASHAPAHAAETGPHAQDGILWARSLHTPAWSAPLVTWAEPARHVPPEAAPGARWVVGLETVIDPTAPAPSFRALLGLAAGVSPESATLLDVNTGRWLSAAGWAPRARPAQFLWVTHVTRRPAVDGAWLRTRGLNRCGRPELEMLNVPADRCDAAAGLLDEVAELLLDEPAWPAPGAALAIGPDLTVALSPWEDAARRLPDPLPGGLHDVLRGAAEYVAAVVCDPAGGCAWWPRAAVERASGGAVAIFRSLDRTAAQADLAQSTWHVLAATLRAAATGTEPFEVMIEAACGDAAEHVWFRVDSIDGDQARGRLMDHPLAGPLTRGHQRHIGRAQVSDWRVRGAAGAFDPQRAVDLARLLAATGAEPRP
jgi:hypothetical protein